MSESEKVNESVEGAKKNLASSLATVMALKDSNPKVFFGGIAGVVLLVIILLSAGGGDDAAVVAKSDGTPAVKVTIGGRYILKSPNSYDPSATVHLLPVPGTIAAFDEAEAEDKKSCTKILQGTHASVLNFQDAYGKKDTFAQVKIEEGDCKDKEGWVLSVDLQ